MTGLLKIDDYGIFCYYFDIIVGGVRSIFVVLTLLAKLNFSRRSSLVVVSMGLDY